MRIERALVFDMDGTIADLYNVPKWLEMLRREDVTPYVVAEPLYNMKALRILLGILKERGWKIVVNSWLSKDASEYFKKEIRIAKKEWLDKYDFPYDEIHLIQYGRTKADATRDKAHYQVLVDDNEKVRKGWKLGNTIDATKDIIQQLLLLLEMEI